MPSRDDHCDVCRARVPRSQLRRMKVREHREEGSNYFQHSSYDGTFWLVSGASYDGDVANGLNPGRVRVADDSTTSVVGGSAQFTGTGTILSQSATDLTGASSVLASVWLGLDEAPSSPITIKFGMCQSDGTDVATMTYTISSAGSWRPWLLKTAAEITAGGGTVGAIYVKLYVPAGAGNTWWADGFQLEKDTTTPRALIKTSGTAVTFSADDTTAHMAKLCRACFDKQHKRLGPEYIPKPNAKKIIPVNIVGRD